MKILIPSYLEREQLAGMIADIERTAPGHEVFASCAKASASVNRNLCLDQISVGDVAIMLDDDISGFYDNWVDDLLVGLTLQNAVMVSARLMNADGTFGGTCSECFENTPDEIVVREGEHCIIPSAAIAFVYRHRYDNFFEGSGWEDNDVICQYRQADPNCDFIQSNRCQLIHRNEMKNQKGPNWRHNYLYFKSKWPHGIPNKKNPR